MQLDEFIHKLVSIQSEKAAQIATYDIIYIQTYLAMSLRANRTARLGSTTWRNQFLWLVDIMARLSDFYIRRAQAIEPSLFAGSFFTDSLMSVLTSAASAPVKDMSSYAAYARLDAPAPTVSCQLGKTQLTQQLEFKCSGVAARSNVTLWPRQTRIEINGYQIIFI